MVIGFTLLLGGAVVLKASLRQHYALREIVSRSDLIVVAKMKEGSLLWVPETANTNAPDPRDWLAQDYRFPSWHYRLELLVSDVLKGELRGGTSVVAVVQYGLEVL